MIYVFIPNELKTFESDIRDLCMAFFPMKKMSFVHEWEIDINKFKFDSNDIVIKDYFRFDDNTLYTLERIYLKTIIKKNLYDYLNKITNKRLLWGTLTGIRPTNIAVKLIEDNKKKFVNSDDKKSIYDTCGLKPITYNNIDYMTSEYVVDLLKKDYYVSEKKARELVEIANNEISILNREKNNNFKNKYSIYIGIPFCKSTCLYCSFTSFNISKYDSYVDKYLSSLENELKYNNMRYEPMTLYIGGGTPTSLDEKAFERLLNIVDKYIDNKNLLEYTIEAGRPDTITKKKLEIMKEHGVSRISINPQTFNQATLDLIGRKHTVKDIYEKYYLARELNFDNINMDIILGLPNEHIHNVLYTLFNIYKLKPDSLTVHSLALKRAARLNLEKNLWFNDYYFAGFSDKINSMFDISRYFSKHLKLEPYYLYRQKNMAGNLENVGYAKKGLECIYNIMMMSERHTVYGFGTATTKKVYYENDNKRIESIEGYKSIVDYCNKWYK